jgi:1-acyl-sn-glycerol-3-phosphate acyltransferase
MIITNVKFRSFFWTQFLGALNDNLFKNALIVLITFRGVEMFGLNAASLVAVASGIFILPFFLFSPLAGQIADRFEKSKVIRTAKFFEILIMLVASLGFFFQNYYLLLLVLFFMGTQSTFFGPVKYSLIPNLVHEDELTEGNAFIELGTFLAILIGTITGGVIAAQSGVDHVIGICIIFVALFGYFTSRNIPASELGDPQLIIKKNPFPEFISLFKLARKNKVIFNSILGISWFWFFGAGVLSVLPIYVKEYLGANEDVVTLFLAMFTLGIGLGSVLSEYFSFKRVELGIVPIGSIGMTIFLLDLFFVTIPWSPGAAEAISLSYFTQFFQSWRLIIDFFLMSVFGGIFIVPLYTILQERSEAKTRSRVIAANNILNAVFMVLASILVLIFYNLNFNTAQVFATLALLNFVVAVYIYGIVPEFTLRFYSWILSKILYRVKVTGLENIPKNGACILASNHVSYVDWILIAGACKRPARFIMYYKFFTIPIVKIFFKHAKVIPIAGAKESLTIMKNAFKIIDNELKNNEVIFIFPEGQLTKDGELSPFRPGIKKIMENNSVPVIPVVITGLWKSIFSKAKNKDKPHRRKVGIEFLPPLEANNFSVEGLEAIISDKLKTADI